MIGDQRVLAVIIARGGSKGVVRKNVRIVGGKPMIAWSIDAANSSRFVDRVILSTDDDEIGVVARQFNCDVPFHRPPELATDSASSVDVLLHAVASIDQDYEWIVLLQPTSPLRLAEDIDSALERCTSAGAEFCVSVSESSKPLAWMFQLLPDMRIQPCVEAVDVARRQDAATSYFLNGAVYVARLTALRKKRTFLDPGTIAYVMPRNRSIDIDDELDLFIADSLLRRDNAEVPT